MVRKPTTEEELARANEKFATDGETGLAAFTAFDADGKPVDAFRSEKLAPYDLSNSALAADRAGQGTLQRLAGSHIVVVVPVVTGKQNQFIGSVATAWSTERIKSGERSALMEALLLAIVNVVIIAGVLTVFIRRTVSRPIDRITLAMDRLAHGDLATAIPCRDRRDEIGTISTSLVVFQAKLVEGRELEAQSREAERIAAEDRQRAADEQRRVEAERNAELEQNSVQAGERANYMKLVSRTYEHRIGVFMKALSLALGDVREAAGTIKSNAENTTGSANAVSDAAQHASTNVDTVAAAAEKLSEFGQEIASIVGKSSAIAGTAVEQAKRANEGVVLLDEAAQRIGEVVSLINEIASQTNLLALNATIEAARAGEAGKGFAVVASEVKSLAGQTAKATDEITTQVRGVQDAMNLVVDAMTAITGTIDEIDNISAAIADAVQQQAAATEEISSNVHQAATGTGDVAENIVAVTDSARKTGDAAARLLDSANAIVTRSGTLRDESDRFLKAVRAG